MNGLRIYVYQRGPAQWCADSVFYTRRAGGPYYQWHYEELRGCWLGSRMQSFDLSKVELVSAHWKQLPTALKVTLGEHYVD
jgi:hypothetical protein